MSSSFLAGEVATAIQLVFGIYQTLKTTQTSIERLKAVTEDLRRLSNLSSHLRETINESRMLIDAICVNQQHNGERGNQISLMRQTHERSSSENWATALQACQTDLELTLQESDAVITRFERSLLHHTSRRRLQLTLYESLKKGNETSSQLLFKADKTTRDTYWAMSTGIVGLSLLPRDVGNISLSRIYTGTDDDKLNIQLPAVSCNNWHVIQEPEDPRSVRTPTSALAIELQNREWNFEEGIWNLRPYPCWFAELLVAVPQQPGMLVSSVLKALAWSVTSRFYKIRSHLIQRMSKSPTRKRSGARIADFSKAGLLSLLVCATPVTATSVNTDSPPSGVKNHCHSYMNAIRRELNELGALWSHPPPHLPRTIPPHTLLLGCFLISTFTVVFYVMLRHKFHTKLLLLIGILASSIAGAILAVDLPEFVFRFLFVGVNFGFAASVLYPQSRGEEKMVSRHNLEHGMEEGKDVPEIEKSQLYI